MSAIDQVQVRITALTAYGRIGRDAVRLSLALINGSPFFVRDDTRTIITTMPTEFRTALDVTSTLAKTGKRFNLASVVWASIPAPSVEWKTTLTFEEIAARRGISESIVQQTIANYAALEVAKAA